MGSEYNEWMSLRAKLAEKRANRPVQIAVTPVAITPTITPSPASTPAPSATGPKPTAKVVQIQKVSSVQRASVVSGPKIQSIQQADFPSNSSTSPKSPTPTTTVTPTPTPASTPAPSPAPTPAPTSTPIPTPTSTPTPTSGPGPASVGRGASPTGATGSGVKIAAQAKPQPKPGPKKAATLTRPLPAKTPTITTTTPSQSNDIEELRKEAEEWKSRYFALKERIDEKRDTVRRTRLLNGGLTKEERKTVRQTKKAQLDNQVMNILHVTSKLQESVIQAEETRQEIEEELLEQVAHRNTFETIIKETNQKVSEIRGIIKLIDILIPGLPPTTVTTFRALQDSLNNLATSLQSSLNLAPPTQTTQPSAPPPAPKPPPNAPPVPAPSLLKPSGPASGDNRKSCLLDQIRKGKELKKLDPEAILKERNENWEKAGQAVSAIQSLEATLRDAIFARTGAMGGEDDSDDEFWDDENWDE